MVALSTQPWGRHFVLTSTSSSDQLNNVKIENEMPDRVKPDRRNHSSESTSTVVLGYYDCEDLDYIDLSTSS